MLDARHQSKKNQKINVASPLALERGNCLGSKWNDVIFPWNFKMEPTNSPTWNPEYHPNQTSMTLVFQPLIFQGMFDFKHQNPHRKDFFSQLFLFCLTTISHLKPNWNRSMILGTLLSVFLGHTVDGRNPANQLRLVVYPIVYNYLVVSNILYFHP